MKNILVILLMTPLAFSQSVQFGGVQTLSGQVSVQSTAAPLCTILTASLPNSIFNTAYSQTLQSQNCTAPNWVVSAGAMPPGFTLHAGTGVIDGTDSTTVGNYTFTIQISNASPVPSQQYTVAVTCAALQITSPPNLPGGTQGQPYQYQLLNSGGVAPFTWSQPSGTMPGSCTVPSSGLISCTPSTNGTFNPNIQVVDSCPVPQTAGPQAFTWVVAPNTGALTITTPSPLPNCTVEQACSIPLTAQGGTPPYSWAVTSGSFILSMNSSGVISGTLEDMVDWRMMPNPTRTTNHMSGGTNPHYSWVDADGQKIWQEKASSFHPSDIEVYGTFGQSNNCANDANGLPQICHWETENADENAFTNPRAYKHQVTPMPVMPRYYALNSSVTINNAGPNTLHRTLNCELDGEPNINLGQTQATLTTNTTNWGGSVGSQTTIENDVFYTFSGGVYQQKEAYSLTLPFGLVQWQHSNWNGSIYVPDNTNDDNIQSAGGAGAPVFPCFGNGFIGWIGGTPGAGGNAQTPQVSSPAVTVTATVQVTDNVAATASKTFTLSYNPVPQGGDNRYCATNETWSGPATDGPASAPQTCVRTALADTPSPGATVTVTAGSCSDLQAKINAAVAGQTIIIPAMNGTVQDIFTNCRIQPAATGNVTNWITVRTDQMGNLPAEGSRISPAFVGVASLPGRPNYSQPLTAGTYLPKITTGSNWTIQFATTAAYWRFIGIELTTPGTGSFSQIVQSAGSGWNHIVLDRLYVHGGDSATGQSRNDIQNGVAFNVCTYCAVIDSYISDIHCTSSCTQSQGVGLGGNGTNATGPLKVVNNFIESAGENVFSGGSGATPPAVILSSSDVEVRRNHLFKPLFWKTNDPSYFGTHFEVDNHIELKNSVRTWIEGNILDQNWGYQGSQQGNAVIFGPRNQSSPYSGSASSDGSGTLTWISGTHFNSLIVSQYCAVPFECLVVYNGVGYHATSFISTTQVIVTPSPPAIASASFTAYNPGLNPNAVNNDIVFRYNTISHSARVGAIAIAGSNGGDVPAGLNRVSMHDNTGDDINGFKWTVGSGACCVWSTGWQITSNSATLFVDQLLMNHNTFIEFLTGGAQGLGPGFGFGVPVQVLHHQTIINNISAGGFGQNASAKALWDSWVPTAELCFDHNFFAIATNPLGPNGQGNFKTDNNPPYPGDSGANDNGGCSFGTTGNTQAADYTTYQFTNLNGGVGGNYKLLGTSPYHNAASDGIDPGANIDLLNSFISGVN